MEPTHVTPTTLLIGLASSGSKGGYLCFPLGNDQGHALRNLPSSQAYPQLQIGIYLIETINDLSNKNAFNQSFFTLDAPQRPGEIHHAYQEVTIQDMDALKNSNELWKKVVAQVQPSISQIKQRWHAKIVCFLSPGPEDGVCSMWGKPGQKNTLFLHAFLL